ncbi:ribbon-helix-helix protein, CopG family [Candidatus Fermentibacterales bacterium]|nr:ribbon-helix-helix protein, CopG family [Candidatus Fermentibacterales bacterium]
MTELTKRATVYLDPELHKALRLRSLETSRSVSELINEAIRKELAEDAEDLASFRVRQNEPAVPFEEFVNKLKADGKL